MTNPYAAPSTDSVTSGASRRPVGVTVLSVLTGVIGFVLLAAFVVLLINWEENNDFARNRRLAPSVFWLFSASGVVVAFVACVGMWRGTKWGWWIACCTLVLSFLQNAVSAVTVTLSQGISVSPLASMDTMKFVVRAFLVAFVLTYWLRTRVREYFRVEQTGRIKAVALAAVWGIGITTIITVVLQSMYLLRTG